MAWMSRSSGLSPRIGPALFSRAVADLAENDAMTASDRTLLLVVIAAAPASYLIGFLFPPFQHPLMLAASPLIGFGIVVASERWSRRKKLVAVGVLLVAMIPLIVSPSLIGQLF